MIDVVVTLEDCQMVKRMTAPGWLLKALPLGTFRL